MRSYFILMVSILAFSFIAQPAQAGVYVSFHDRPVLREYIERERVVVRPYRPQRFSHFIATEHYAPMREIIVIRRPYNASRPRDLSCDRARGPRYNRHEYRNYY